jgi:hypothetical protein
MKKLVIAALLIAMISGSLAQSTGAAPSFQSLGDVQPGQNQKVTVYVTATSYDQTYTVNPEVEQPLASRYLDPQESPIPVEQFSEEDISGWVTFDQPTFAIDPTNSTPYVLSDGSSINANGEVTFTLSVPSDAEPGWHAGAISLNPEKTAEGAGYGAQTQTLSRPTFAFNVQTGEEPERRLEVVDARGIRTGESTARIDMRVANRGTVTTSIQSGEIDVYNRETENRIGGLSIGYYSFQPQQSEIISATITNDSLSQGSYMLNGSIDYSSSEAFVGQQTFALSSQIQSDPESPEDFNEGGDEQTEEAGTPMWLVGLFILVISAVLYSFGFDLFWILVAAGFIGIALFIVLTGVPNWVILVLLTTPVIILYYA